VSREVSFGQGYELSWVDRLGVQFSAKKVRRAVPSFLGLDVADIGCGYEASLARSILPEASSVTLVDVALAPDIVGVAGVHAIVGKLPEALKEIEDASFDVILCLSVLEHLWEPDVALGDFRRLLRGGGVCVVNIPSWFGKWFLELSAFKLGLSPAVEMDDHKRYYDPRDIWPLLVRAGFPPHGIKVQRHKFGLNTFATCRLD
jgi:SAM-dependent methyltransferase